MVVRTLSLCTGYAGLELGLRLAGVPTSAACYVEREAYAAANLVALMEEGALGEAPVWSDLTTFDALPWRGAVDLVTAGFPCQPFSAAGKRKHTEDERWLWPDIDRILHELRCGVVFLENVPGLTVSGLGPVLGTLASLGFDAEWGIVRASDAGAPHRRARLFILGVHPDRGRPLLRRLVADSRCSGEEEGERRGDYERPQEGGVHQGQAYAGGAGGAVADADRGRLEGERWSERDSEEDGQHEPGDEHQRRHAFPPGPGDRDGWERWRREGGPQPGVRRGSDGTQDRVERLRLLGNGVVPHQAALAFKLLWERMR